MENCLIVTAASKLFENSLLALIGSANCNWPNHPRILVYDLGMTDKTLERLESASVEVRKVPAFCPHWRKYFTWKFWCLTDIPAKAYLWLDAGTCILRPMPEVFEAIEKFGYFCCTNHWDLKKNMSMEKQRALGLSDNKLAGMVSINSGVFGLKKDSAGNELINKGMQIALIEKNMIPTAPLHRHDQPIFSALLCEIFGPVLYADFLTYAGWLSPIEVINQKIWVHRRRMLPADQEYFATHIAHAGRPYLPQPLPVPPETSLLMRWRVKIARWRGRLPPSDIAGQYIYDGVKD